MRLSVVIPTQDRIAKLKQCLDALAKQGPVTAECEVVVVDDGSTDATRAWLATATGQRWPFVLRAVRQEAAGPAAARNAGVRAASGESVLFLGDDCVAAPGLLQGHLRAHSAGGERSVLGHATWLPELTISPFMHYQENGGSQFAYGRIRDRRNAGWNFYYTTNVSTPRRVLLEHPFDERFPAARYEDMELGWRLSRAGHRIEYLPEALCWHDHPVRFDDFRRRSVLYGEWAALFHRLHPEPVLARALGIEDARAARFEHLEALAAAERVVEEVEALFPTYEPASDCFGVRGAMSLLFDAYRLLIHQALVTGIRRALDLPALPAASPARPERGRPRSRAA